MKGTSLCQTCEFGLPDLDPAEKCPIPEELEQKRADLRESYALPADWLALGVVECRDFKELARGGQTA